MAVPELGQIRIIPDMFAYHTDMGQTVSTSISIAGGSLFNILDHRTASQCIFDTNTSGTDFNVLSTGNETGRFVCIVDGHDLDTQDGKMVFEDSGGSVVTTNVSPLTSNIGESGGYITPTDDNFFAFHTTSNKTIKGVAFYDVATWDADVSIGILHIGVAYEMPTNTTASLSYNTKFQNKVNTAFSGASYSTLYNINPQRIIKASWEYVNWSGGSSGIDDFTFMIEQCFGSHIPVAIQLSQDGSVTSDYFMFARITNWNQTQMSPTLWQVSAEFTEFI